VSDNRGDWEHPDHGPSSGKSGGRGVVVGSDDGGVSCAEISALLGRGGLADFGEQSGSGQEDLFGTRGGGAASLCARDEDYLSVAPEQVSGAWSASLERGELQHSDGRYKCAEQRYLGIIESMQEGDDPQQLAASLNNLAVIYATTGDYHRARTYQQRALAIIERVGDPRDPVLATCLNNLAEIYRKQGLQLEVEVLYERSLEIRRSTLGENHPDVAVVLNNLAELYREQGCLNDAETLFEQALGVFGECRAERSSDRATVLNNLGLVAVERDSLEQAGALYEQALVILQEANGEHHLSVATTLNNMGLLRKLEGSYRVAEELFQRAYDIEVALLGRNHPNLGLYQANLAALAEARGDIAAADQHYSAALEVFGIDLGPSYPMVLALLQEMRDFYSRHGKRGQVGRIERRLEKISRQLERQIYGI